MGRDAFAGAVTESPAQAVDLDGDVGWKEQGYAETASGHASTISRDSCGLREGTDTAMERETDKHSPRIDDAMSHDLESLLRGSPEESRAREDRLQEDPDVGPGREARADEKVGLGVSASAADQRAELARYLAGAAFPARRDELVYMAEADQAPPSVLEALRSLPADEQHANVQSVWQALGGEVEGTHTR